MTQKKRKVELFKLTFNAIDDSQNHLNFFDFVSNYLNEITRDETWKKTYFKVLRNTEDFFVLGITTTKMYGIPPINDFENHESSAIPLSDTEGLGYFNIILYDKNFSVLYFEFVQNGCWLSTFIEIIKEFERTEDCPYDITISATAVLRTEAYERLMNYGRYGQIELKIAAPTQMILSRRAENDAILSAINYAQDLNADVLDYVFKIDARRTNSSLNQSVIRSSLAIARRYISSDQSQHFLKFKVTGFHTEGTGSNVSERKDTIDLVKDKFIRYFTINEPRVREDLQILDKTSGIIDVYQRCLPEIGVLFRRND